MTTDHKPFYELVKIDQEEILLSLRLAVSDWAHMEIKFGDKPEIRNFLSVFPEWNHSELHPTIESEMKQVTELFHREGKR